MPNGIIGTNVGQGLPPVKVNWQKNRRNWQRQENDFLQGARKLAISLNFFCKNTKNTSAHAQQSVEQNMSATARR